MPWLGRYARDRKLGHGTYGTVYRARDRETKRVVAIKRVRDNADGGGGQNDDAAAADGISGATLREIHTLRYLAQYAHQNVVQLLDVVRVHGDASTYLVFECLHTDLRRELCRHGALPKLQLRKYARDVFCGLDHCHQFGCMHRDLKPEVRARRAFSGDA